MSVRLVALLPDVVTRKDALAKGLTAKAIEHRLRTGRWQAVYPRTYVTFSGPIGEETRLAAVLAYVGARAALSHESAAARHGLRPTSPTIHVTVDRTRRVVAPAGVIVHHAALTDREVRTVRGLPCTSVERTVVDLVALASSAGAAANVLVDAVGSRRTSAARLRQAVTERPAMRHRAVALEVLTEARDGVRSPLELRFVRVCRTHALPVGTRQARMVLRGRVVYADDMLEEWGIPTELDGKEGHSLAGDRLRDYARDNAHVEAGRAPLRYGWADVLDRPCEIARQRAAVLRQRGWTGTPRPCGPVCAVQELLLGEAQPPVEGSSPHRVAG